MTKGLDLCCYICDEHFPAVLKSENAMFYQLGRFVQQYLDRGGHEMQS